METVEENIALHNEWRLARERRTSPQPLREFAREAGIPEDDPVPVQVTLLGDFASGPSGWVWVTRG